MIWISKILKALSTFQIVTRFTFSILRGSILSSMLRELIFTSVGINTRYSLLKKNPNCNHPPTISTFLDLIVSTVQTVFAQLSHIFSLPQ